MAKLYINEKKKLAHIEPEVYGHFSEHLGRGIYEGIYVGENSNIPNVNGMRMDVVSALKELNVPMLRWPGGCFADEYHWKDGVGPKESRRRMINTNWGGVVEDNSFGTHEFMELCRQLGCKKYINGNMGSGTVQEMSEWIEYMTLSGISSMADWRAKNGQPEPWTVDFFGVGNENWGCGGNMTPEHYANEYRRYQTYVRDYDADHPIKKVCCGANAADYYWTKRVLETAFDHGAYAHGFMDYLSLHYYVYPEGWDIKGSATDFDEEVWYKSLSKAFYMDTLVTRHSVIMDEYDPEKKIGMCVDEWGAWYSCEPCTNPGFLYQQNTVRDALIACITLNIFNKHADRVKMAALAQMVNVLQSVLLTEGDMMIKTPTYHVMHMYRYHQDADLVESGFTGVKDTGVGEWKVPALTESVSAAADGTLTVTMGNLSVENAQTVEVIPANSGYAVLEARIVTHTDMRAHNTFEEPDVVREEDFTDYRVTENGITAEIPANSVVLIRIKR